MKFILHRREYRPDGVFSDFISEDGSSVFVNLDHAFLVDGKYLPKLAPGVYLCRLGKHTLEHHPEPFDAYEILGVPDFMGKPVTKILIHWGNFNKDSDGCTMTGLGEQQAPGCDKMIIKSREAFAAFMAVQNGVYEFLLTVTA